jgi:drug/metabolite transporter (DMT)-like permease
VKAKSLLLILLCALCWGPSYLFIKLGLTDIQPITLAFLRIAIGGAILYAICRFQKQPLLPWKKYWKHFLILGVTFNAFPFFLFGLAEVYITSSLAGILNSCTLIFTAILTHYFGAKEPFTKNKVFGIAIGVTGLAIVYIPIVLKEGVGNDFGALLVILACLSYATGTLYAKSYLRQNVPAISILVGQMAMAGLVLIPFSLLIDRPFALPGLTAMCGALGLGVLGTAGGFYFYYKAIHLAGATYASFSVLLVPILAMILGAYFLDEALTWNLYAGTALILIGVAAINPVFNTK